MPVYNSISRFLLVCKLRHRNLHPEGMGMDSAYGHGISHPAALFQEGRDAGARLCSWVWRGDEPRTRAGTQTAKHKNPVDAKLLRTAPARGTGAFPETGAACQNPACRVAPGELPICTLWLRTPDFGSQRGEAALSLLSSLAQGFPLHPSGFAEHVPAALRGSIGSGPGLCSASGSQGQGFSQNKAQSVPT